MFPKLSNSKDYVNDLQKYKNSLEYIQDTKTKQKYAKLISELEEQTRLIDNAHNSSNNGYVNPVSIKENVINAYHLRRKLNKLLKDLDRT